MAINVNTNVTSMTAQRNLNASSSALATSMERLSSGNRINSAKDDAAGLQISNRLNSQVRGLGVAMKNANDGISMAQTAEGAMQESTNILQRMRDLALQSANGSNSDKDRAAMQKEISSLQSELTRIAETTSFGGQKLLDGSFGSKKFQIGSNSNETLDLKLSGVGAKDIGLEGKGIEIAALTGFTGARTSGLTFANADSLTMTVGGKESSIKLTDGMSAADLAGELNAVEGLYGVGAVTEVAVGNFVTDTTGGDVFTLNVDGVQISYTGGAGNDNDAIVAGLNGAIDAATTDALTQKGISVSVGNNGTNDFLVFTKANGENVSVTLETAAGATDGAAGGQVTAWNSDNEGAAGALVGALQGSITVAADATDSVSADVTGRLDWSNALMSADFATASLTGAGALGGGGNATVATTTTKTTIADLDIGTFGGAQSAIDVIDSAIAAIDDQRSDLGAFQNRMSSTINNLANIRENAAAGMARIKEVDFAEETVNLTKQQILQQAGTSVLAQAKQLPQAALSLLG
ncbi:hypothetical protein AN401_04395 [Zobellella denitrificans]|uniref:Flagellin n=1 Tax=Zobellella denitrificans TaxID=347534 RepID=A0A291HLT5_9GAMM|nr:flagellin [Zobellella denitrificans]ATG73186.1 hypothetical protein AN401_04395 [Zobellella denitrificans]